MMKTSIVHAAGIFLIASSVSFAVGCKGSPTTTQSHAAATTTAPAPTAAPAYAPTPTSVAAPTGAQAQRGAGLYAQSCAMCHGAGGAGTAQGPALIGPGAMPTNPPAGRRLRTGAFSSAKDIGMFIKDRMPPGKQTPPDQTGAILAFLLQSNGVRTNGDMNPSSAASIPWQR